MVDEMPDVKQAFAEAGHRVAHLVAEAHKSDNPGLRLDGIRDVVLAQERELIGEIDKLSQVELARLWRAAPAGHPYFEGQVGDYFIRRFKDLGGMTPEISKLIGW